MKISTCTDRPLLSTCELENFDYQVDPYIGCEHYCYYCYVLNEAETDWQKEILVYKDIHSQLSRELKNISPQKIYMGYYADPYQPCEEDYRQTRQVLEILLANGFSVSILTKSDLVVRDLDLLKQMDNANVSVSVAFNDNQTRKQFEASTINTEARITALKKLKDSGVGTSALICPVIPYITDAKPLIDLLAPCTDKIWIYGLSILSPSDTSWQNMQRILEKHYSDQKPKIEEVIFSKDHSYWEQLREELSNIQRMQELDLRIHV
jgi:DNA repair photolyase